MATKREEKERRRREREAAERREAAEARRRLMLAYVGSGLLVAIILVAIVIALVGGDDGGQRLDEGDVPAEAHVDLQSGEPPEGAAFDNREGGSIPALAQADLEKAAEAADCEVDLSLPDEGNQHIRPGGKPVEYDAVPPTSGDHNPVPAADGAYLDPLPEESFVHSLEHGRVAILYSPDLPEEDQLALKGLFDEDTAGMLLFPYADMPYDVAAVAWTSMVTCERYSDEALDVIRDFRDQTRGAGPEPLPL